MGASESRNNFLCLQLPAEREGESPVYRSWASEHGLLETCWDDVHTLFDGFQRSARLHAGAPCLGWRENDGPYKWMTYSDLRSRSLNFGAGILKTCGLKPGNFVGLWSINQKEWIIAEQGSYAYSLVPIPLYDTLGPDASQYIINQSEMTVLVVSKANLPKVKEIAPNCPTLRHVIVMEGAADEKFEHETQHLLSFEEVEKEGAAHPEDPIPPKPTDLATICYTSGTTGDPKGVMLSHRALLADISSAVKHGIDLKPEDVHISYLPLAHMMERIVSNGLLFYGASIGFFRGDIPKLFDDISELKPTLFVSVPRLFNRVFDKVITNVNQTGGFKKTLFEHALNSKKEGLRSGQVSHMFYDSVVFGKVRDRLGGRVRLMVTGSAPISSEVMDFLRCAFSCPIIEGYGQTETAAAMTCTLPDSFTSGDVGIPLPAAEVKLVDVPDMGYTAKDKEGPRGEVCCRGPLCCDGYYKNEEKTKELFDEHGWLHTGDIGLILPNGCLRIIDRKKNLFKLAQGEYVAPEKIENILTRIPYLAQVYIHGESLKSTLVSIMVPDFETLVPWAQEHGIKDTEHEALCQNPEVKKLITQQVKEISSASKLHGFEVPRAFHLTPEAFSVENDLLTPTFKLKRPQAKAKYLDQINSMYAEIEP